VHQRRVFLLAFAAFFLVSAAWSLALPTDGTYDERQHIVRAYAVAEGKLLPDGPASDGTTFGSEGFDVAASLLPDDVACLRPAKPARPRPASCQSASTSHDTVRRPSAAARYSPVYYLPVGVALLISPDHTGVVWARLVSALMSALLLAAAVAIAVGLGSRLLVAGVALVATPMAVDLFGSVNPNGLEIAAGVLVFVVVTALLRGAGSRRLLVVAGMAAAILLTVRQLGPVLLAVDVAACVILADRTRVTALLRSRDARRVLGASVAAGALFTAAWTLLSGGPDTAPVLDRAVHGDLLRQIATVRVPFYVHQVVGQFGYGETTISPYAIYFWYVLWLAVVVPAVIWGGGRLRLVLAGLLGFCLAMLVALDWHFAPLNGWFSHGRYALPTGVGVVLLAASADRGPERWLAAARSRWLPVVLVAATAPVHGYALARVMTRYQSGIGAPLDPFGGGWSPPGGPVPALVTLGVGLGLLVIMVAITYGNIPAPAVIVSARLDNGSVTPNGQRVKSGTKASTTDTASQ
jgi:hypothetical protein